MPNNPVVPFQTTLTILRVFKPLPITRFIYCTSSFQCSPRRGGGHLACKVFKNISISLLLTYMCIKLTQFTFIILKSFERYGSTFTDKSPALSIPLLPVFLYFLLISHFYTLSNLIYPPGSGSSSPLFLSVAFS